MFRVTCLAITLLACWLPSGVHASLVLDQQFEPSLVPRPFIAFNEFNEDGPAQTFTVGVTGTLDRVDVLVNADSREGKPFVTGATTLAAGSFPLVDVPGFGGGMTAIDLSAADLMVEEGDVLAILVRRDRGGSGAQDGVAWYAGYSGREPEYAGGAAWEFSQARHLWRRSEDGEFSDFGFRTYVAPVPEPAALSLVMVGFTLLIRRRRDA